jgi:hypothetical protein
VAIESQTEQNQVESRDFADVRSYLVLVQLGSAFRRPRTLYWVNVANGDTDACQQGQPHHLVIAVRMVEGDASLVAPVEMHVFPVHTGRVGWPGQHFV